MPGPLGRLAGGAARHPLLTLAVWVVALGAALLTALTGVVGESLFDRLKSEAPNADGESSTADDVLAGTDDPRETFTLAVADVDPTDVRAVEQSASVAADIAAIEGAELTDSLAVPRLPDGGILPELSPLFAEDGDGFLLTASVPEDDDDAVEQVRAAMERAEADFAAAFPDATVELGGNQLVVESIVQVSERDLQRGEAVALPIALLVMLVVFGGFLAAGVPLVGAVAAIAGGLGVLYGLTFAMDIDTTVVNVVTAVGLGLSIDYGLLIVSRFREEYRGRAADGVVAAVVRTADRAGMTVAFSGVTFGVAALALLAFEPRLMHAVGLGAVAVTVIAIASALTLVPALLALAGARLVRPGALTRIPGIGRLLLRFGDVAPEEGFFSGLARRVQRHPAIITLASAAILLLLGSPLLGLRLANTSVDALPASSTQYGFLQLLDERFPDAAAPRIALVTGSEADAEAWAAEAERLDGVESVAAPREAGDGWVVNLQVDPADGIQSAQELRADRPAPDALVTGTDARTLDLASALLEGAPLAALIVALGTFALLFLMTGSFVVPIKALLASALSLGASIGVLVWGFQLGHFAPIMGFDAADVHGVDVLVLVLTFAFGFGLAMDYEMFILSRVKELVDAGVDDREAIARGLQRSGRIISSAALIIIVVFAGFATGDLMVIKQLGTALAVAVLLDATLVRCLLVPALMTWQRRVMWWSPRWAKRLHARFGLSD